MRPGSCVVEALVPSACLEQLASCRLFCSFQAEDHFALFHQIELIAGDCFEISWIGGKQSDLAALACERTLLFVYLRLQIVDLGAALQERSVWRDKKCSDAKPDRDEQQKKQDAIQSLPDGGFATRPKIAVCFHVSECYCRKRRCHPVLLQFAAADCILPPDRSGIRSRS